MKEILEVIKHTLGLCGESHMNIWTIGVGFWGIAMYMLKHNITWCWNKGCHFCVKSYKSILEKKH